MDIYSALFQQASLAMAQALDAQIRAHRAVKPKQWGNPEILRDRDGYPMTVHGESIRIRFPQAWTVSVNS